jgi:hypothetical protein
LLFNQTMNRAFVNLFLVTNPGALLQGEETQFLVRRVKNHVRPFLQRINVAQ